MRTGHWDQFGELVSGNPRLLATITAHNSYGHADHFTKGVRCEPLVSSN
jgi:hypothetical protein